MRRCADPAEPGALADRQVLRLVVRTLALLALGAAVLAAAPALAHATLQDSSPGTGTVLESMPRQVVLTFDEAVTTMPGSVHVFGPRGQRVDSGSAAHPGGVASRVEVAVHDGGVGTYLVSWRVISDDTHPASGSFTFSVGHPSRAPSVAAAPEDHLVDGLLGFTRWLGYAGIALLIGSLAFLELCWRRGWETRPMRDLPWIGLGGVLVATVLGYFLKGPYDAGLSVGAMFRTTLLAEVAHSSYGDAARGRVICLAVIAALLACRRLLPRMACRGALTVSCVALALTFALSGHAATAQPVWLGLLVDTIHVGAMSLWIGGLVGVVVALGAARAAGGASAEGGADIARFSALALGSVVVLILSGTYQSWRRVGAWAALVDTTYGRELLVKIGLVALVLVVAAISRQLVGRGVAVATAMRRTVTVELLGAVVILAVTSVLVATEPAAEAYHPSVSATLRFGRQSVQVSAAPDGVKHMRLQLDVLGPQGQHVEPEEITVSAALPGEKIGGLPVTLRPAGPGRRIAELAVPLTGTWQLTVTVRTSPIDESSQVLAVPVR